MLMSLVLLVIVSHVVIIIVWKIILEVNEVKGQMLMPLVLLVTVLSFNFPATEGSDNFLHNFLNFQIIFQKIFQSPSISQ